MKREKKGKLDQSRFCFYIYNHISMDADPREPAGPL